MVVRKDEWLPIWDLARHGQGDHQARLLVRAVFDNHVATMLGDDLLRERNSDSAVECWLTVEGKEQLIFVKRSGVEAQAAYLDDQVTMVGGSGNGEFTTFLHTS